MYQQLQINIQYKSRERQILNALLATATGVLTLIYPSFLYLIAAGYLIALGLLFIYFKVPVIIAAFPVLTGVMIFIFPNLIPITLAVFLGFFGLLMLLSLGFIFMGILTLVIAALIMSNPDSVAYLIAAFLFLYGFSHILRLIQQKSGLTSRKPLDRNEIIIEEEK